MPYPNWRDYEIARNEPCTVNISDSSTLPPHIVRKNVSAKNTGKIQLIAPLTGKYLRLYFSLTSASYFPAPLFYQTLIHAHNLYDWQSSNRFGCGKGTAKPALSLTSEKIGIRNVCRHDEAIFTILTVDILNICVKLTVRRLVDPNVRSEFQGSS